jgi:hypothetical protein
MKSSTKTVRILAATVHLLLGLLRTSGGQATASFEVGSASRH